MPSTHTHLYVCYIPSQTPCLCVCVCMRMHSMRPNILVRGLLIHSDHVDAILQGKKTYEIRNNYCRIIQPDGFFYILRIPEKGQGKNKWGQSCLEIAARVKFVGNHFIPHEDFHSFFDRHQVSQSTYTAMSSGWKKNKGGCVAWQIELDWICDPAYYLPSSSQDCLQQKHH